MTDELSAISVGLQVNLGSLDRDIAQIQKKVGSVSGDHFINFKVGKVDVSSVREQIRKATSSALPVNVTAAKGSAAAIRRELAAQLKAGGPIPVQITANLGTSEITRIRQEITRRLGQVPVEIKVSGGGGGAGGAPPSSSAPVTPHERKVADDLAVKVGRASKQAAAQPSVARAAPAPPRPASSPTVAVSTPQRASTGRAARQTTAAVVPAAPIPTTEAALTPAAPGRSIPKAKPGSMVCPTCKKVVRGDKEGVASIDRAYGVHQRTHRAEPLRPTPVGVVPQDADFGTPPTGPASSIVRRFDASGKAIPGRMPRPTDTTTRILRRRAEKAAGRRVSSDELRDQKIHTNRPETPEEIEYAGRPMEVSLHDPQTLFDKEKRGRGVRGASRSGARQRGEPVLTPLDRLSTEIQSESNEYTQSRARDAAIRAPARGARGWLGTPSAVPWVRRGHEKTQFHRISPAFGAAFDALQAGDLDAARQHLRGESQRLATANPKERKKFFKLFRNIENVPPNLLEAHAGLQALFTQISQQTMNRRVSTTEAVLKGIDKEANPGGYVEALEARKQAKREQDALLRGFRRAPSPAQPPSKSSTARVGGAVDKALRALQEGTITRAEFERQFPHLPGREGGGRVERALGAVKAYAHGALPGAAAGTFGADLLRSQSGSGFGRFGRQQRGLARDILSGKAGPRSRFADELFRQAYDSKTDTLELYRHETGQPLPGRGGRIESLTPEMVREGLRDPRRRRMLSFATTPPRLGMAGVPLVRARVPLSKLHASSATTPPGVFGSDFEALVRGLSMNEIEDVVSGREGGGRVAALRRTTNRLGRILSGRLEESQILNREIGLARGGTEESGGAMLAEPFKSPWVKRATENPTAGMARPAALLGKLDAKDLTHRAMGGRVGGLAARLEAARAARDAYIVGEKKPETYVGDSGRIEIVGEHGPEVRSFPEPGIIKPFVPEWIRRGMAKERGMAKDLTGAREAGGPVRGFGGRAFRSYAPGEKEAISSGLLTKAGSAAVQRVFVVNFPAIGSAAARVAGITSSPAGPGMAAGPSEKDIEARVDKALKDLLKATKDVRPVEPEAERPERLVPEELARGRIAARQGAVPLEERVSAAGHVVSEREQLIPSRGAGVMGGQLFQTIFGGRGAAQTRVKEARESVNAARTATAAYRSEQIKLNDALKEQEKASTPQQKAEAAKKTDELTKSTAAYGAEAERLTSVAEKAGETVLGTTGAIRSAVSGLAGIAVFSIGFGAVLGGVQAGIGALTQVISPAVERLTGFRNTSAAVTSQLADQTRQQNGAVQTTIALATAQAGLSKSTADVIAPQLEQRAQTEAGNKALTESIALLHTYESVRDQNVRRGGRDQGLTSTTGGFFGTILNGIPSTSEQIGNELANVQQPGQRNQSNAYIQELQGMLANMSPEEKGGSRGRALQVALDYQKSLVGATDSLDAGQTRIKFFNDAIQKGGEGFKFVAQVDLPLLDDATRELAANAADAAGAFDIGRNIRDKRTILVDSLGRIVTNADDVSKALQAVNVGLTTPDPALLIKQLTERVIPAQRAQIRAEGNLQRNVTIPGQFALNQLANPTPGIAGGPSFEAGLVGKGDKDAQRAADAYKGQIGPAIDFINKQIEKGHQALLNLVPPDLRAEFSGILDDITATGQQISKIQTGIQQEQVNLAVAEYNNQLRIARRSLGDAKDLQAGIAGATKDTLGGLEGQNILLSRQAQLLQFAQSQRQINFAVAKAGFQAPGQTAEERSANIAEAKYEADFAQKQLDIAKTVAGNQFKEVKISASRDVTDLIAQIGLLEQGRTVVIDTAAAQRALDILTKKQELLIQQAGTYLEEGGKIVEAAIQAAAQVMQQTGKGFGIILSQTNKAWGLFGDQAEQVLAALLGTAPPQRTPPAGPNDQGSPQHPTGGQASGIVGSTIGPTELTLGEAGREKVAILRNPKLMPPSAIVGAAAGGSRGGGNSFSFQITINGDVDRASTTTLVDEVVRRVEDAIDKRAGLIMRVG